MSVASGRSAHASRESDELTGRGGRSPGSGLLLVLAVAPLVPFALLAWMAQRNDVAAWDSGTFGYARRYEESAEGSAFDSTVNALLEADREVRVVLVALAVLAIALITRRLSDVLFAVATGAAVVALTSPLKDVFDRVDVKYAFPSGHAAFSAAFAIAAAMVAWPTRWRWPTVAIGAFSAGALGAALVYEGWHLPSDVLGGWCLALSCAALLRAVFGLAAGRKL